MDALRGFIEMRLHGGRGALGVASADRLADGEQHRHKRLVVFWRHFTKSLIPSIIFSVPFRSRPSTPPLNEPVVEFDRKHGAYKGNIVEIQGELGSFDRGG
ncbi:MAG TPA: hypothetical protein VN715_12280 [Roseiarcus sp.]|nr:hypothetical protein [Roseiarcus sp.]